MKINFTHAAMFAVAVLVWLAVSAASGGREAWDVAGYWSIGLPLIYLSAGVLAFLRQGSVPWRLALWSGAGQFAGLLATASGWSLWPLGLIMLAVLSLPALLAALVGTFLRGKLAAPTR